MHEKSRTAVLKELHEMHGCRPEEILLNYVYDSLP